MGTFSSYDKSPDGVKNIERMCKMYEDDTIECTEVDMVFYDECPTECDGEINVVFYSDYNELEVEE